jgi:hypothetical protein
MKGICNTMMITCEPMPAAAPTISENYTSATTSTGANATLDCRHIQMVNHLTGMYSNTDRYLEQVVATNNHLNSIRSNGISALSDCEFESYASLLDKQRKLKREYTMIKDRRQEIDYLLETADIIFSYYDVIDHNSRPVMFEPSPSASASSPSPSAVKKRRQQQQSAPSHHTGILKYFSTDEDTSATAVADADADDAAVAPTTIEKEKGDSQRSDPMRDRATLLELYMSKTDPNYMRGSPSSSSTVSSGAGTSTNTNPAASSSLVGNEMCPVCRTHTERVPIPQEGMLYCPNCHAVEPLLVDHERPSYKEPPKEITYFAYKRINHLNEWLSQTQGKESTEIPAEVYDRILLEIRKQRITNMAKVTTAKIKEILKRLGLTKYYEHVTHIMQRLNGLPSIQLKPEIEDKLRQMFKMIQIPFFKHAPKTRKNFLSYSYTIHKCLQLLELDEYLPYFPLLKSREKTFQMDTVWKKICEDLNWHFYPSC